MQGREDGKARQNFHLKTPRPFPIGKGLGRSGFKPVGYLTVTLIDTVWVMLPDVAVTVTVPVLLEEPPQPVS